MNIDDPAVSQFVFHPRPEPPGRPPLGITTRTAGDGATIAGVLHPHPDSHVLMLFFHGNGEIAADYDELARFYVACGVSFWVVDFRGYGNSSGRPSYSRMLADAEAVARDIQSVQVALQRPLDRVVVMGRSLGSASAIALAATHPDRFDALLLDSPFADGPALIQRLGGPALEADGLGGLQDNIDHIRSVRQPCLIIHGTDDWIIPVDDAKALHAACPSHRKHLVTIDGAGHNDLLMRGFDTYFREVKTVIAATFDREAQS